MRKQKDQNFRTAGVLKTNFWTGASPYRFSHEQLGFEKQFTPHFKIISFNQFILHFQNKSESIKRNEHYFSLKYDYFQTKIAFQMFKIICLRIEMRAISHLYSSNCIRKCLSTELKFHEFCIASEYLNYKRFLLEQNKD